MGYIFKEILENLDNDDDAYTLKVRCDGEDYGSILKRLFGQSSSQIKFQYLPTLPETIYSGR